jgi:hypothetical protein
MGSRSWSAVVACAVVLFSFVVGHLTGPGHAAPAPEPAPKPQAAPAAAQIAGRASCSGRGCHGRLEPSADSGIQQNEFVTWLNYDKHARAFEVLKGERAQRMARNLGIKSADEDSRCLACHCTPQLAGPVSEALAALRSDGVSCEACHGPAKGADPWLTAHTMASWNKGEGRAREEAFHGHGMTPLFDLEVQAKTCAGCHVGAAADPEHGIPARDLNHDLMAAGHPRLTFELGTYRANLPPHWRSGLHGEVPGYEASVWAIGQAESARASVELLAHRAREAAARNTPWPEFAESSCFACHADLRTPSWRRNAEYYSGRKPGAIPVNRWYTALLPSLDTVAKEKVAPADKALIELAKEMNKPYPDPAKVETLSVAAREALGEVLATLKTVTFDAAKRKDLAGNLARKTEMFKEPDWDEMTQAALAAAALHEAASREAKPEGLRPLDDVFRIIAFPRSYESPEGYSPHAKTEGDAGDLQARLLNVLREMAR